MTHIVSRKAECVRIHSSESNCKSAMVFPVRTKGTGNTEHMFSQWGLMGTGNREQGTSQSRAKRDAPQGRRRPMGKKFEGGNP